MLERLGECGKEGQTTNQGQAELYSEDPGVGSWQPERELGVDSVTEVC